ncbi:hypothetical protein MLD38_014605 [Melastoma candidum]|uniref:Uncharacterized protein n=1 Tax=Melastoma candidum TaxID=119954 RepID=A0ACB9REH4_9MYRT|nr:hypothetical protein MLD38_014605 [Melastoma candidum]
MGGDQKCSYDRQVAGRLEKYKVNREEEVVTGCLVNAKACQREAERAEGEAEAFLHSPKERIPEQHPETGFEHRSRADHQKRRET